MTKLYKNKIWLQQQYQNQNKNTFEIARILQSTPTTINYWLRKFNIPVRSRSDALSLVNSNHVNLSQEAKEFIDGELLGDAAIYDSKISGAIQYGSKYEQYLEWLSIVLKGYGIEQVGHIYNYPSGYNKNKIKYQYHSRSYLELKKLRTRWYPNGKKIVPDDIELTPLACRQWYIGDGCLQNRKWRYSYISFSTYDFSKEDVLRLVQKLRDLRFKSNRQPSNNVIRISTQSVPAFINYIGSCPKEIENIYGYKWSYKESKCRICGKPIPLTTRFYCNQCLYEDTLKYKTGREYIRNGKFNLQTIRKRLGKWSDIKKSKSMQLPLSVVRKRKESIVKGLEEAM